MAQHHHTMNIILLMAIIAIFVGGIVFFWQANMRESLEESVDMLSDELMQTQEERADSQLHIQSFEEQRREAEEIQKEMENQLEVAKEKLAQTQFALIMRDKNIIDFIYDKDSKQFFFIDVTQEDDASYYAILSYNSKNDNQFIDRQEIDIDGTARILYKKEFQKDESIVFIGQEETKLVFIVVDDGEHIGDCEPKWTREELYSIDIEAENAEAVIYVPPREFIQQEKEQLASCEED